MGGFSHKILGFIVVITIFLSPGVVESRPKGGIPGDDFDKMFISLNGLGARISEQVNADVKAALQKAQQNVDAALENVPTASSKIGVDLSNLGITIHNEVTDIVNKMNWYKGPNVCLNEKTEDLGERVVSGKQVSYSNVCNQLIEGEFTCTTVVDEDGRKTKTVRTYKCCDNFSLKYVGDKLQCSARKT
ncbi:hypothetical protein DMENIID0001_101590 [Sergentomyia squamirostris]